MRHAYSFLFCLLLPLFVARLLWRSRRAPAYRGRLAERLGFFRLPDGTARRERADSGGSAAGATADRRPLLWIHAVSLGETLAARPLIERLLRELPHYRLLVTTTTPTGSEQVRRLFRDEVLHVYAPWDTPGAVARFLRRTRPRLLILMETELWPNMLRGCARQNCAVILANARLSARSAAGYGRFPGLTGEMLASLRRVVAQSDADAGRFVELGMAAERIVVGGSIKFDVQVSEALRREAARLAAQWHLEARPVALAASTHRGEDGLVLDAFQQLQERDERALLLLAPRHPERFDEVCDLCIATGLRVQRRSTGEALAEDTQVLLVDTLGELLMLFGLADVAFIGGSFVPNGGHNPLEAAVWGIPVLTGPSMFNFADVTRRLLAAGALEQVSGAGELAAALRVLLGDQDEGRRRGAAALQVVDENRGALDVLFAEVLAALRETTAAGSGIPGKGRDA
jgi:3-deoxy-D-manno-octulosonic-acid transferase